MIQPERICALNDKETRDGTYVLYWMQASQRADDNHALAYAIDQANLLRRPVVVAFGLMEDYPDANERHFAFMLQGLAETAAVLAERGIQFVLRRGPPELVIGDLARAACLVVTDRGYLHHQRRWRRNVARHAPCRVVQVETDVLVPVELASGVEEYAARTIRPKLQRHWSRFLVELECPTVGKDSLDLRLGGIPAERIGKLLPRLSIDRRTRPVAGCVGGCSAAQETLAAFCRERLRDYAALRSDPAPDVQSHLSAYLHFGQVSPLRIALRVRQARGVRRENKDAFLEELLVRRELCMNFALHNELYDDYEGLPDWAQAALRRHRGDKREYVYSLEELENSWTHDAYFNAAMTEMRVTGRMHSYMRMYWGKKIIEWARTPRIAFRWMLALNNKHFLDGRDPVSYGNVAWCFGKHDRPWGERPVFGTIRYMSAAGLERKFDIDAYVRRIEQLR